MKRINWINWIILSLFIVLSIFFLVKSLINNEKIKKNFYTTEYHGRILEIDYLPNRSGLAIIKIDKTWYQLGELERKIQDYIIPGDSIAKKINTFSIEIYRQNNQNEWEKKVFE